MKAKPFFSIITVCYNEEENIEKTCKSIINQNFKNFEWLVIDGKSTDNTLKKVKKYSKVISKLISEKDSGPYNAMNKGIRFSKGKFIIFLNGGDFFKDNEVLKKTAELIKEDKESAEIYYGDLQYDNQETVSYRKSILNKDFFKNKTISHQATFIKKQLFKRVGQYDERYKIVADFDFWIKAIIIHNVRTKHIPAVISVFNQKGISTNVRHMRQHIDERNEVLMKYGLITEKQAKIQRIRFYFLAGLKKIKLYSFFRKIYRSLIPR
jgi:glycosyltransferase involved in cell wall biosynthesis